MDILITGALGQLGRQFKALEGQYPQHHFLYTDIQELDITSREDVAAFLDSHKVDALVNCAAYTAVNKAEEEPDKCALLNHEAPVILTMEAKKRGVRTVHISTDYVFDGLKGMPYNESDATAPLNIYGKTKADMERDVLKEDPSAFIIRTSWLYSPWGQNFPKTILSLLQEKEQISVVTDQTGSPTYTRDLSGAILDILDKMPMEGGLYHYCGEGFCSWYDFARTIQEYSGLTSCHILPVTSSDYPQKARRPLYSVLDCTRVKETFKVSTICWKEALRDCLNQLSPNK